MKKIKYARGSKKHAKQIRSYFKNQGYNVSGFGLDGSGWLYYGAKGRIDCISIKDPLGQLLLEYGEEIKFDEPHFEPFQKVLVRSDDNDTWRASIFSHINPKEGAYYKFICVGDLFSQCISYEGNEHLLGTTDNPE